MSMPTIFVNSIAIFCFVFQSYNVTQANEMEYLAKSWLIISALYLFFFVDRVLQSMIEFRRVSEAKIKHNKKKTRHEAINANFYVETTKESQQSARRRFESRSS